MVKRSDYPQTDEELQECLQEAIARRSLPMLDYLGVSIPSDQWRDMTTQANDMSREQLVSNQTVFSRLMWDYIEAQFSNA